MSRKRTAPPTTRRKPEMDARVRRTRDALGDALIALLKEEPFDAITVRHVLDRAGVGRSTFYAHYRGKDDLFLSDVEDFLEPMSTLLLRRDERSHRVAPVREFLSHVGENLELWKAMVAAGKDGDFLEMAHGHFARAIEKRLAILPDSRTIPAASRIPMSHALAGSFLSVMSWWMDHQSKATPAEMDDAYHQLAWSGIGAQSSNRASKPLTSPAKAKHINHA